MASQWRARLRAAAGSTVERLTATAAEQLTARTAVRRMIADVDTVVERDPAARTRAEVALLYPGVHAIWAHRVSHSLWRHGAKLPARAVSQMSRFLTAIEIHPGAEIGERVFIDHGAGVVIGETAVIGDDVTLYHGVTLGGVSQVKGTKRHPNVGAGALLGAGAKLLGPIDVGEGTRVGANAVLVKSVSPGSVVVGVPGQVLVPEGDAGSDPLAFAVKSLLRRVERLEAAAADAGPAQHTDAAAAHGAPLANGAAANTAAANGAAANEGATTASGAPSTPAPHRRLYRDDGVWDLGDYAI